MTFDRAMAPFAPPEPKLEPNSTNRPEKRKPLSSWMALTLFFTNVVLVCLVIWAYVEFGSIRAGIGYLAEERLSVDATTKSVGEAAPRTTFSIIFHLTNRADRAVTLLGAKTSCTCLVTEILPRTLRPAEEYPLKVEFRTGSMSGKILQSFEIYTDYSNQPILTLKITGVVVDSKSLAVSGLGREIGTAHLTSKMPSTQSRNVRHLFETAGFAQACDPIKPTPPVRNKHLHMSSSKFLTHPEFLQRGVEILARIKNAHAVTWFRS